MFMERRAMKRPSRREFLQRMGRLGTVAPAAALFPGLPGIWSLEGSSTSSTRRKSGTAAAPTAGFTFTDIAAEAGLAGAVNVFGEATRKRYILEETGCGVALFDYDNDGWLDIFMVNGTRLEGISP